MIATLCASDNQVLGKALTATTLKHFGVDLSCDKQAKRWFEGRMRIRLPPTDFWTSNIICVLDQLLLAYNFHYSKQEAPTPSSNLLWLSKLVEEGPWDPDAEVREWERVLDWLEGKCTFCAGRGYGDEYIGHSIRRCKRGGASKVWKGIGEMMYEEGFVPSNGCKLCRLPRDFCPRWVKRDGGGWRLTSGGRCKYSTNLLCDGIIGFYSCGVDRYRNDVYDEVEADSMGDDTGWPYDVEEAAEWLSKPLVVAGVEASEMVRQLSDWTKGLDPYKHWRTGKREDGGTKV